MQSLPKLIKPPRVDEAYLYEWAVKRYVPAIETIRENTKSLKDVITPEQKVKNMVKLGIQNYIDPRTAGCANCIFRHTASCKNKSVRKFIDKDGQLSKTAIETQTTGCKSKIPETGKKEDDWCWRAGKSTTVVITDTTSTTYLGCLNIPTWAGAHDAANAGTVSMSSTWIGTNTDYDCMRTLVYWDTSSIDDSAVISAAKIMLYLIYKNTESTMNVVIQETMATTPYGAADYDYTKHAGNGGITNVTAFATGAYHDYPFNAMSYHWINLTGNTYLAMREEEDVGDSAPTDNHRISNEGPTHASGHDPKISVTYSTGIAGNKLMMWL